MTRRTIDGETYQRGIAVSEVRAINEENRTVELSIASELPYPRWFGDEILKCTKQAVDLSHADGMPVLWQHDHDIQLGVVESFSFKRGKLRAVIRFSQSPAGEEKFRDVADAICKNVSIGYRILDYQKEEGQDGKPDKIAVTRWLLYEVSLVTVPADPSVGLGRSIHNAKGNHMTKRQTDDETRTAIREEERERCRVIRTNSEKFGCEELGRQAIDEGWSISRFNEASRDHIGERNARLLAAQPHLDGYVDLPRSDFNGISILRMIRLAMEPTNATLREQAAHELAVARASLDNLPSGVTFGEFVLPWSAFTNRRQLLPRDLMRAPIDTGVGTTGASLVSDNLLAGSFIEKLRNTSVLAGLTTDLNGLDGNVSIPRQKAASAPEAVAEGATAPETGPTFDQIMLQPHRVSAYQGFTGHMLRQSTPDIETLIRGDFGAEVALVIDRYALNGTGTNNQPQGILNTTGINSVDFNTDGQPTFQEAVKVIAAIMADNAWSDTMLWVANASGWEHLKTRLRIDSDAGAGFILANGRVADEVPMKTSQQVPTNKHLCGDFSQLIFAAWGGVEFIFDPYTQHRKDIKEISVHHYIDFGVRHPAAFCQGT